VATAHVDVTVADGEVDVDVREHLGVEGTVERTDAGDVERVSVTVSAGDTDRLRRRRRVRQLLEAVGLEVGQYDRYPTSCPAASASASASLGHSRSIRSSSSPTSRCRRST